MSPAAAAFGAALLCAAGFFLGACIPLYFELAAELTYPLAESISSNIIVFVLNAAAFIFVFVTPSLISHAGVLNLITAAAAVMALALFALVRPVYRRRDFEIGADQDTAALLGARAVYGPQVN